MRAATVQSMATYRIFDTAIRSRLALPELHSCAERDAAIEVTWATGDEQAEAGFAVCHDWRREAGPLLCTSARRGRQYRLSFPGRASFDIHPVDASAAPVDCTAARATIACRAWPGVSEEVVRQLLLGQVIPRYLAHCGALLLHASAVTLPTGRTVAFLGASGQGKSTLAAYCRQHGAQLIDDDCVLLRVTGAQASIVGGMPGIRLTQAAWRALGVDVPQRITRPGVIKHPLALPCEPRLYPHARELDALLLLSPATDGPADAAVSIAPVSGQAAMMALLHGAFQLDPTEPVAMARVFSQVAGVLRDCAALPVHRLCYPRRHHRLPDVLRALLEFLPG